MIRKILMISDNDITSTESLGVTKKLLGQYKAFNNLGYDTYHLCFKDEQGVLIHGDNTKILVKKQPKMYFAYLKLFNLADKVCKENAIDMCYIRYPLSDFAFMKMIKRLHTICKVVVEIPTYPYLYELKSKNTGFLLKLNGKQDLHNQKKLHKYIDRIVTFDEHDELFGIKTIKIDNGINIDSVKYIGDFVNFNTDINIIGVALIVNIHGYDRLIEGLKNYYSGSPKRNVNFYIVGDGNELPRLKEMTKKYSLSDHVVFTGVKYGDELDRLFENSTIGVASLAAHRRGSKTTSELKVKEYCARGLPYIATSIDHALPENAPFVHFFPADESAINISNIVEFVEKLSNSPNITKQMRKFAEENLTWEKQLEKVMEEVKSL